MPEPYHYRRDQWLGPLNTRGSQGPASLTLTRPPTTGFVMPAATPTSMEIDDVSGGPVTTLRACEHPSAQGWPTSSLSRRVYL